MYFKFIKFVVLLSLLVCCRFAGRVCRARERSTSHTGATLYQMKNDPRSCDRNPRNCVKQPEKNSGLQRGLNPWPQASLRNCGDCDHNCEDHSSFDFISAVHIWFIWYASFNELTVNGYFFMYFVFVYWTVNNSSNLCLPTVIEPWTRSPV